MVNTSPSLATHVLQTRSNERSILIPPGASRTLAYLFDYPSFARAVPAHREHALLSRVFPSGSPQPISPTDLPAGPLAAMAQLAAAHSTPWLTLTSLHTPELSAAASAFAAGVSGGRDAYAAHEAAAFRPAPELLSIARHVVGMIHRKLGSAPHGSSAHGEKPQYASPHGLEQPHGSPHALRPPHRTHLSASAPHANPHGLEQPRGSPHKSHPPRRAPLSALPRGTSSPQRRLAVSFDCLHVRERQWSNTTLLHQAASSLFNAPGWSRRRPVLLVGEEGIDDDSLSSREAHRTPSLTRMPMTVLAVLPGALRLADFFPHWDLVEVSDASGARTLAYDVVQQLVCAQADRVVGQASSPFVEAVCHWRAAGVLGGGRADANKLRTRAGSRAAGGSSVPGDACGELRGRGGTA
jgi:hypothetical protein